MSLSNGLSVPVVNSSGNRPEMEWLGKEGQQGGGLSRLCYLCNPTGKRNNYRGISRVGRDPHGSWSPTSNTDFNNGHLVSSSLNLGIYLFTIPGCAVPLAFSIKSHDPKGRNMACACSSEKAVVAAAQFKCWEIVFTERLWVKAGGTNGSLAPLMSRGHAGSLRASSGPAAAARAVSGSPSAMRAAALVILLRAAAEGGPGAGLRGAPGRGAAADVMLLPPQRLHVSAARPGSGAAACAARCAP